MVDAWNADAVLAQFAFADDAAHLAHLADVYRDRRDADDVVVLPGDLARTALARWEVEQFAWCGEIRLDHHDAPGAMEHEQRKTALGARYLIVIELHRSDGAAAILVV